jgi:hypothetical protein
MGQSASTAGRGADGRRSRPARGSTGNPAEAPPQRQAPGGYPGAAYPGAAFNQYMAQNQAMEGMRPELASLNYSQRQPPPAAALQRTFTIRNDVNLKKHSLKMVADDAHPHLWHREFVFDAATECSVAVYYAATEVTGEMRARYVKLKEGGSLPKEFRPKGLGQT